MEREGELVQGPLRAGQMFYIQHVYGQGKPGERHTSFRFLPPEPALTLYAFTVLEAVSARKLVSLTKAGELSLVAAPRNSLRTNPFLDITLIKDHDRARPQPLFANAAYMTYGYQDP